MPPLMQLTKTRGNATFMRVMRVKGVDVNVHWTVFLVGAIILLNAGRKPVLTLVGLLCYLSVLLIHEIGHLIAAQRRGSQVLEIRLYPIHGKCIFQTPWSRFDHCVIAWGGVIAQAIVAVPLLLWLFFFGYTRFDAVNAVLAILGAYSMCVAAFNLLPARGLDGSIAWSIIPEYLRRRRSRPKARSALAIAAEKDQNQIPSLRRRPARS